MVDHGHGRLKGSLELGLVAAPRHGSSSVMGQRREGSTGSPSQASPGRGRRCGDRATAVKRQQWCCLVEALLKCGERERRAGRGVVEDGGALPFYRGRRGGGGLAAGG
jgi:hypothetical protein